MNEAQNQSTNIVIPGFVSRSIPMRFFNNADMVWIVGDSSMAKPGKVPLRLPNKRKFAKGVEL